jgi:6-phosphogluconolactonase
MIHNTTRTVALAISLLLLLAITSCGGSSKIGDSGAEVLYAAFVTPNGGGPGGHILPLTINATSGALTALNPVLGPGNAVTVVADPSNKFLYSSDFNTGTVYGYSIDPKSGNLKAVSGSPYSTQFSGNGGPIAIDPGGKFVFFVADPQGDIVTFMRNPSDGTLTPSSAPAVLDTNQPFWLVVDPAAKFLYAADQSDPNGGEISVFAIDSTTGALTSVAGSPFTFQPNSEPWGMAMSSNGQFLFTALWNAGSVAVLSVDSSTGAVASINNSPFSTTYLPEQLVLHPSGKFLYTGNINQGSISAFSVNATTGALSSISGSPYSSVGPIALAIDPSGKYFFFSQTFPSSQTVVWQIDQNTGALSPGTSFPSPNGSYPPTAMTAITLPGA